MIPKKQQHVLKYMLLEFLLLNVCVLIVIALRTPNLFLKPFLQVFLYDLLPLLAMFNLAWWVIILNLGNPKYYIKDSFRKKINHVTLTSFIFIGLISTLAVLFNVTYFNRTIILLPIFLFSGSNLFLFTILSRVEKNKTPSNSESKILLVGGNERFDQIVEFSKKMQIHGYATVGFLNGNQKGISANKDSKILGTLNDLARVLDDKIIDEIFVSGASLKQNEIQNVLHIADNRGVRVNLIPASADTDYGASFKVSNLEGFPIFKHRQTPLDNFNNFLLKRTFDSLFALLVLVFLFPLYFLLALLIKLDSKGPVFYKPIRKGEAGNTFECFKFRTMHACDDAQNGTQSTVKNDPRITRIGKYLRKYDLDELPQFWNVLKGEMSVVGPRPHRVNLQNDFRKIVNDYMVRHYVRPGITGWAQVNGWRGPTVTVVQKKERIKYDLWYIENWSFLLDLKIVMLTVFGKETRKNAF